jgi:hypothetical protein
MAPSPPKLGGIHETVRPTALSRLVLLRSLVLVLDVRSLKHFVVRFAGLVETRIVQHTVTYIQENDAKYEKAHDKLPFIERIEIKALGEGLKLIVKGFDPERQHLL